MVFGPRVLHRNENLSLISWLNRPNGNSTTSGVIERMAAADLVTKTRPKDNQRTVLISLTKKENKNM